MEPNMYTYMATPHCQTMALLSDKQVPLQVPLPNPPPHLSVLLHFTVHLFCSNKEQEGGGEATIGWTARPCKRVYRSYASQSMLPRDVIALQPAKHQGMGKRASNHTLNFIAKGRTSPAHGLDKCIRKERLPKTPSSELPTQPYR